MKAKDRLRELIELHEDSVTIDRFVSLTNPKNTVLMEAVVAWTRCHVKFDGDSEVDDDATMEDMWLLSHLDTREFANTVGLGITDALAKMKQMINLELVYPDGTASPKALSIVKMYVKGKLEDLG